MKDLLAPAIAYAREGFPVSEAIAFYFELGKTRTGDIPTFAEVYMPDGEMPKKGEMFRNPRLGDTLELIAEGGRDAFYKGDIARRIDAYMTEQGGLLRYDDLAKHHSEWVTPVSTNYRGWDVYELPPSGQGIAALQILNILEDYDLVSMGFGSAEYLHTFVEAKKLAFEDRAKYYVDMDFADVPVDTLISKDYAATRRALISPTKAAQSYAAGDIELTDGDTIYMTVADSDGNMVSLIQSNYIGMGSGMTPGDLGFVMQNRGKLFALDENHANALEPGKRPFHTIIPAFVMKDGKPLISFGLMGGAMQPQGHAQIIINMVDFGMNLQAAGDAARINHIGSSQPTGSTMTDGGVVHLESGFSQEARDKLTEMGHTIGDSNGSFGGYQAIFFDEKEGVYYGASEVRKDGQAAGY
jgi:gamma-glutamyltranspeptidase/glutathione hydrolase